MATTTNTNTPVVDSASSADELTAKTVHKRYENLVMVRTKAIKGKGAWYWAHLEPILVHNTETNLPKAVKLRCSLCDAVFSASNPSRTASEHLKRGTCPNFNSLPKPISSLSPSSNTAVASPSSGGGGTAAMVATASVVHNNRKRSASAGASSGGELAVLPQHPHLMLSGGKEDLGALAMLEDSVKKLKSPKTSPGPALSKTQIDCALDYLADWVYESCGSRREFCGDRLDVKFEEAKAESEARIRDAMFFQIASDGWKVKSFSGFSGVNLVNLTVNLPNGTSLYRRVVFVSGSVPSKYAEEVLWETISGICGNAVQQCVGIIADRFKSKALRNLERVRACRIVESALTSFEKMDFGPVYTMLEDILSFARALPLVLLDESYKIVSMEDPTAREVAEIIRDVGFWNELEAVHSLVKLTKEMAQEIETERPLVGQCLPLWDELRAKVKDWCSKFHIAEGAVEKVIERRFKKNYHPAWAAAYILDPLYLVKDSSGKYLPPFKCLTPEQEKDVDKLITRLVSTEEAHIALMELMKWRTEGLDPVYARAVQMKERDPITGKMKIVNPQSSRLVWETYLTEFKSLGKVAVRLIFLHATACGFKCNWSLLKWVCPWAFKSGHGQGTKVDIIIAAHSKLERREFSSDEDKDAELFALANGKDDSLNEVLVDTFSV
ncbi:hypothetical protein GH714_029530 [Hevea brasiliensis]|uniref:DUF7963 domain-containing protein n=1 Tax=Hevea brasiliensis TaxID=3981 RepID=A0A6A6LC05_HEVBR|nr:hypothetical protein GH714_029530 [Hevea brasiliensis]